MSSKDLDTQINRWYDSLNVGKAGGGLKLDIPLDNTTALDLRFIKNFVQRSLQCLVYSQKWEKLCSLGLKFNALTRFLCSSEEHNKPNSQI